MIITLNFEGFVAKFGKISPSLYLIILTDGKKNCGVPCSPVHNTISYSNDCGNYVGMYN